MTSLPLSCSQFPSSLQNSLLTKFPSSNFQTRPQQFQVIRCNSQYDKNTPHLDRRNLLVGMGGLYGAASNLDSPPAFATPISGPDFTKCTPGRDVNTNQLLDVNCCPPMPHGIIDYKLPHVTALRFRPAAHLAGKDYIAKYEKALQLMKALPPEDPRSFTQQANVHCAYCNLTYPQTGDPDLKLQIHFNWLFFPWHRWYLYFYERILGKLIDDPNFGLPFWNWDHPDGMFMPDMFKNKRSPLYNAKRDQRHGKFSTADLRYDLKDDHVRPSWVIIRRNLQQVHSEMVGGVRRLSDFYGARYVTGTKLNGDSGQGSIERGSHTALHLWVGDPTQPNYEDMGNFYSAGREPLFFSHHANIDRLWSVYQGLQACMGRPGHFRTPDWLDANFLFYNENAQLVRVRVGDALDNQEMGYTFQKVDMPWLRYKREYRREKPKRRRGLKAKGRSRDDNPVFPVKLDKVVRVLVDRPRKSRSKEEKEKEEELLVIEGIEVDSTKFVRFEVYINDEDDKWEEVEDIAEYVGNYSQVPHKSSGEVMKSKIRLGLGEVLEDLDADDDDQVLVSLVPQAGGEDVIIGGIKIIYDDEADEE